jgi:hypothetical protein
MSDSVSIINFQNAVKNTLTTYFAGIVNTVIWYEQGENDKGQPLPITTPAIILEIESADEGDDLGDNRAPFLAHLTAYCILGQQTQDLQTQVRTFAGQLFSKVRKNKWGLGINVSFPGGITMGPGKFDPEATGYESWFVSWDQTLWLDTSIWDTTEIIPTEVYWSWSPDIGIPHEDDYELVPFDSAQGPPDGVEPPAVSGAER